MEDSMRVAALKWVARVGCIAAIAAAAQPASASNPWIETHVAASYGYVLGKGEAAGRGLAVTSSRSDDPKAKAARKAGSSRRDGLTKN